MRKLHKHSSRGISITLECYADAYEARVQRLLETTDVIATLRSFLSHFLAEITIIKNKKHTIFPRTFYITRHGSFEKTRKIQV